MDSGIIKRGAYFRRTLLMKRVWRWIALLLVAFVAGGCGVQGGSDQSAKGGKTPTEAVAGGWRLTLKVSVPDNAADSGLAFNRLVAGGEETATNEYDNGWDIRALLTGPMQAYFSHAGEIGYETGAENLFQDIRPAVLPAEWIVEVTAESGRIVTVRWTLPEGDVNCDAHGFLLEDFDGELGSTDLCASDSLSYEGDDFPRRFVLRVS